VKPPRVTTTRITRYALGVRVDGAHALRLEPQR